MGTKVQRNHIHIKMNVQFMFRFVFLEFKAIGYRRNYAIKVDFICLRSIHRIMHISTPRINRKYILPVIKINNRTSKSSFFQYDRLPISPIGGKQVHDSRFSNYRYIKELLEIHTYQPEESDSSPNNKRK